MKMKMNKNNQEENFEEKNSLKEKKYCCLPRMWKMPQNMKHLSIIKSLAIKDLFICSKIDVVDILCVTVSNMNESEINDLTRFIISIARAN